MDAKFVSKESPERASMTFVSAGENYVDQLAVLRMLAENGGCMIAHGG